jgi:hypothetical protein
MTPSLHGRCHLPDRAHVGGRNPVPTKDSKYQAWSIYGAKRAQPVATGRKWEGRETGSNSSFGNRWQPMATVSERMVKRTFATACHRLPKIPFLLERGSISWLRKELSPANPKARRTRRESNRRRCRLVSSSLRDSMRCDVRMSCVGRARANEASVGSLRSIRERPCDRVGKARATRHDRGRHGRRLRDRLLAGHSAAA